MAAPTVFEKFSNFKAYKRHDGDFGLEIETETLEPYKVPTMAFWETHADGSLRHHGIEYVLKQPLKFGPDLEAAYTEFADKTGKFPFIEDSITTSVHVHMNILNENFVTLGNIFTVYALVEQILIEFSGPSRKSNLFCLGMADAEETYKGIKTILKGFSEKYYAVVQQFDRDNSKYSALNLAAMSMFGSLEFRSFRGTADVGIIRRWVGILHEMLEYCRKDITPHDIIRDFKNKGSEILQDIFGEYRRELRCKNEEKMLEDNFWYAAQIAYSLKDWALLKKEPAKKKPSAKDLDRIAIKLYNREFNALGSDEQRYIFNNLDDILESLDKPAAKPKRGAQRVADAIGAAEVDRVLNEIARDEGRQVEMPRARNAGGPAVGAWGNIVPPAAQWMDPNEPRAARANPVWVDEMPDMPEEDPDA